MHPRYLAVCLLALAGACANEAAAEPERQVVATVTLPALDAIEPLSTRVTGSTVPVESVAPVVPGEVAIIGDSLTVASEDEIEAALQALGVGTVLIDAEEGRRINHAVAGKTSGTSAASELAAMHEPDVWVVALGTNDVPGFGADGYRADIEALLAELPPNAPVIWVDVWIERRIDEVRTANAIVREVAADRPAMAVVDWFQFGDDPGLIISDGIHLTEAGQQRFAAEIAAALTTSP